MQRPRPWASRPKLLSKGKPANRITAHRFQANSIISKVQAARMRLRPKLRKSPNPNYESTGRPFRNLGRDLSNLSLPTSFFRRSRRCNGQSFCCRRTNRNRSRYRRIRRLRVQTVAEPAPFHACCGLCCDGFCGQLGGGADCGALVLCI